MFPANLVDMNPKDGVCAGNFFSVNGGRRCTLGKAVPKDELKHIGHCLLDRDMDDSGPGYVEWDSDRDYFTVEDGAGRKYESRDFAFAANFLFSGQEMLSAGNYAASRMKRLADRSLRRLYKDDENAGYRNGHPTLGGRKGSAGFNRKYVALGLAALSALGVGAYMLGGSQQGDGAGASLQSNGEAATPANNYPDFNSSEPVPLGLAIRDYKTITPLDPVKDLGAGKYKIGDTVIDATDDKPDIALAYGGIRLSTSTEWASVKCDENRCTLSGSVKRTSLRYDEYVYVDKKGMELGDFQQKVGKSRWSPILIGTDPLTGPKDFRAVGKEIKPDLFVMSFSGNKVSGNFPIIEQVTVGHPELIEKTDSTPSPMRPANATVGRPEEYSELIIPVPEMLSYFKCDSSGTNCQK